MASLLMLAVSVSLRTHSPLSARERMANAIQLHNSCMWGGTNSSAHRRELDFGLLSG